jgi:adenine-specific DNA-methyltransferase
MYKDTNQRDFSRKLRENMTDAERRLWKVLQWRQLQGFKFRRQAAIGEFVVDFACFSHKLVIELDGGQHNEVSARAYDQRRTDWLQSQGFRVLRFWNHHVMEDVDSVVEVIWKSLQEADQSMTLPPSPALPTRGRE